MSAATLEALATNETAGAPVWDVELFIVAAASRSALVARLETIARFVAAQDDLDVTDLAYTLNTAPLESGPRVALVASSREELRKRLARAVERLADPNCRQIKDSTGLYFAADPLALQGTTAFLLPGEGAQYLNMLADLPGHFPEVAESFQQWDNAAALAGHPGGSLSRSFLLPPNASDSERAQVEQELRLLSNSMVTATMANWSLYRLLLRLGIKPDAVAGHSMGELGALSIAGGVELTTDTVTDLMHVVRRMDGEEAKEGIEAVLLAVGAGRATLQDLLAEAPAGQVFLAMDNCPHQSVVVGLPTPMAILEKALQARRVMYERLPFQRPYHTSLFASSLAPLRPFFATIPFHTPTLPIYSCTTGEPFPDDPAAIRELTISHWAQPVEFTRLIERMYADGVRIFIESGPRGNLTSFVEDILRGKTALAIPANVQRRSGLVQLHHLLAQLAAHHLPLDLNYLYERRFPRRIDALLTTPAPTVSSSRLAVLAGYLDVMEQFLDTQQSVMESYLARRNQGRAQTAVTLEPEPPVVHPVEPEPPPTRVLRPMAGEILRHEPGQSLLLRRALDLHEDRFATHHTVGGRKVSKIDPAQVGLPVGPMTFTLELMAESAEQLVPDHVVIGIHNVKLFRWLAYDENEVGEIEILATRKNAANPDIHEIAIEIRDLRVTINKGIVAQGMVRLAADYPPAPAPALLPLHKPRRCIITNEMLYTSLFHGEMFEGVVSTDWISDDSVHSVLQVLPRAGLFASTPTPQFLLDPVLLDVSSHPLCAWHLEQPDQSGRVMLPFELRQLDVYGPPLPEGTRVTAIGRIEEQSPRHFTHGVEVVNADGKVWARLSGTRYWRFYVPFGRITFHGPKDEYFLTTRCDALERRVRALYGRPLTLALSAIEPPGDLQRSGLRIAAARVVLTPDEFAMYQQLGGSEKEQGAWMFDRITAKDAARVWWTDHTGEKLFPADIETRFTRPGHWHLWRRASSPEQAFPPVCLAHGVNWWLALAVPCAGAGLAVLKCGNDSSGERLACAQQALVSALGEGLPATLERSDGDTLYLTQGGRTFAVYTLVERDHWVAITFTEAP